MKKLLKISGIVLASFLLLLFVIPIFFKEKIIKISKQEINKQHLNATVNFKDLSISLLRSFPNVSVDLKELSILNKTPFEGDTLAYIGHTYVDLSLSSLLGNTPKINKIKLADVYANIKVNQNKVANYDIFPIEENTLPKETQTEEGSILNLNIESYSLENINLEYENIPSHIHASVKKFNHLGRGDLSQNHLILETHTNAKAISFMMENVAFLKDLQLKYDADIGVDFNKDLTLTFKDNIANINDLNLKFDGVFTMLKDTFNLDFTFESEQSKFKSLLSLIPNAYSEDFPKVATTGALDLHGTVKGEYSNLKIPTFDMVIKTEDASLKYPDLAQPIEHIYVDTHISNATGIIDDTEVDLKKMGFQIGQDVFTASTQITHPISNLSISGLFKGQLDLENLKNAYPMPDLDFDLTGKIKAHITTSLSMNDIEKENYQNIQTAGNITLEHFSLGSDYTPKPLFVEHANMHFSLDHVDLKDTQLLSGDSDITFNGGLDNLYKYIFDKGDLKGRLNVSANKFFVSDFYEADTTAIAQAEISQDSVTRSSVQLKIPENIAFVGNINAQTVVYDAYTLSNFKGNTTVKNQQINFNNATANIFQGDITIDGFVNTKPEPTSYNFDMNLKQVDIATAFKTVEFLKKATPILSAFNGKFDTEFKLNGDLDNDFMPILSNLTGTALANLQVDKIDASQNTFLSLAENKLSFVDFEKTDLKDLKTTITFENSKVNVQPFTLKYKGIPITIGGHHAFDGKMNYNLKFNLPAKYLGKEAQSIVSKLSGDAQENTIVPLNVAVGGTTTKPTIIPGMKEAISNLTKQAISNQKEKVKETIKKETVKKIESLLGGDTKNNNTETQKSTEETVKEAGKKILKGLFK